MKRTNIELTLSLIGKWAKRKRKQSFKDFRRSYVHRQTSPRVGRIAGKKLSDYRSDAETRSLAGSALAQIAPKPRMLGLNGYRY